LSWLPITISSTQESFWRCLEGDVISEGQNFDGKIEIPSSLHYLLPKMEEEEVSLKPELIQQSVLKILFVKTFCFIRVMKA
jgi:hypothetical protein